MSGTWTRRLRHGAVLILLAGVAFDVRADDEPETCAATGAVVDTAGKPVAGAQVVIVRDRDVGSLQKRGVGTLPESAAISSAALNSLQEGLEEGTTTTRGDGTFRVDGLVRGVVYHGVAVADDHGCSAPVIDLLTPADGDIALPPLQLRAAARLTVRIVNDVGEPRADAEIAFKTATRTRAVKQSAGVFVLDPADPVLHRGLGGSNELGIAWFDIELEPGADAEVTLTVGDQVELAGIVVDDVGTPVKGARLHLSASWEDRRPMPPYSRERTDQKGRFRLPGLQRGGYRLRATADGHTDRVMENVDVPADDLRVVLDRDARARIRLVPSKGSAPPTSVAVKRWVERDAPDEDADFGERDGYWKRAWADAEEGKVGEFVLRTLPRGRLRLRIAPVGHRAIDVECETRPGKVIDAGGVPLEPPFVLRGRVRDAAGKPVRGARVSASRSWTVDAWDSLVSVTDADGRYELLRAVDEPFTVRVDMDDHAPTVRLVRSIASDTPIDLVTHAGVLVRGLLRDHFGRPMSREWPMWVDMPDPPAERGPARGLFRIHLETAEDGTFVTRLAPGTYDIGEGFDDLATITVGDEPPVPLDLRIPKTTD